MIKKKRIKWRKTDKQTRAWRRASYESGAEGRWRRPLANSSMWVSLLLLLLPETKILWRWWWWHWEGANLWGNLGKVNGLTVEEEKESGCECERKDMEAKEPNVVEKMAIPLQLQNPHSLLLILFSLFDEQINLDWILDNNN